jgi:hypothetical protein
VRWEILGTSYRGPTQVLGLREEVAPRLRPEEGVGQVSLKWGPGRGADKGKMVRQLGTGGCEGSRDMGGHGAEAGVQGGGGN